jgi:hypothetical protein
MPLSVGGYAKRAKRIQTNMKNQFMREFNELVSAASARHGQVTHFREIVTGRAENWSRSGD